MVQVMYRTIYKLVVPLIWLYNICIENKDMIVTTKITGTGHCRGDRWDIDLLDNIDLKKIERVWRAIDMGDDCPEEMELNESEEHILYGDGGFMEDGMECVMQRIDRILDGNTISVEGEEFDIKIKLA